MDDELIESVEGRVATLTFNRPERMNAFTPDMLVQLHDALVRLAADSAIGAVVLAGSGRAFCAGGDVKRMATGPVLQGPEAVAALRQKMETARLLHEIPKPTIAMVNGVAAGAGLALALACDLRIAAVSARFTTAFAKIGLPGDFGGSYFMTKLLGAAKARELYFSSDILDAERAMELGLVTRLVPDADLAAETAAFARKLAEGPTVAFGYMKRSMNAAAGGSLAEVLDLEADAQIAAGTTRDHREASRAFVEKRTPTFIGR